jgi:phosphinothricin acetyltransferase
MQHAWIQGPAAQAKPDIINSAVRHTITPADAMLIRPSETRDLGAITDIYGHSVTHGTSSFELVAPDRGEMARRRDEVLAKGLPWLVAEAQGEVIGYAYANHFRARPAYRHCLEDSIYLHPSTRGRGAGRALLAEILMRCEALGARQMLAVIGDSASQASIGLHRSVGFDSAGVLKAVGWKFGRWLDVVLMQRALGTGAGQAAPGGLG